MPTRRDLRGLSTAFAQVVTDLLNRTVAQHPVHINAVFIRERGLAYIGNRLSPRTLLKNDYFPLRPQHGVPPLHMLVSGRLCMDHENRYLTVQSSVFAIALDPDGGRPLFHVDYEREKADGYPEAHLQVEGKSSALLDYTERLGDKRDLPKLHFPVGGRRFRPTLEDVIEFLAVEGLVDPKPGWQGVVDASRADFQRRQLRAAIRRHPEIAEEALRDFGRRADQ